jgi:Reverse transcriptase (RNA-dependent DNA polymerase)
VPQGSALGPKGFIPFNDDHANLIDRHELGHHLYADDAQLIDITRPAENNASIARMQHECVQEIHRWCTSWQLKLNPSKTEFIWSGSKTSIKKIPDIDLALRAGWHSRYRSIHVAKA